jgi:hypothetical protein
MKKIMMLMPLIVAAHVLMGQPGQPGPTGVIKELAGTVEIKRAGQGAFVPAKAGDSVAKDTIISTGFRSTALITLGSSLITVKPLTRLTLAEISAQAGKETVDLRLQAGRIRVDVKPPEGLKTDMTVRSSAATASVRGTSFEFDTRSLLVSEGTVVFRGSRGGEQRVSAGSTSRVNENSKAADPLETGAEALVPPGPAGTDVYGGQDGLPMSAVDIGISLDFE